MRLLFLSFLTLTTAMQAATPVLVELFTSEGCSSCPPADRLLACLQRSQPIPGADIIVLSEHVDYWDYIGWKDPFASRLFTDRQRGYAGLIRSGSGVYTPQMVVDGRLELVGSDEQQARAAIENASRRTKLAIAGRIEGRHATLELPAGADRTRLVVYVAIARKDVSSQVVRGENRGRELHHTNVVTHLIDAGVAAGNKSWTRRVTVPRYDPARDRAFGFAQRTDTKEIVALTELQ